CQPTINNLIERYGLHGKSVLSIGAGEGHEEYTLNTAGCRLTLNDVNPAFEAYLKRLSPVTPQHPKALVFSNEDAGEFVRRCDPGTFDVLYVSSLHPDEIRREEIQMNFVVQHEGTNIQRGITWPKGTEPYLQMLMDAFMTVKSGGLII